MGQQSERLAAVLVPVVRDLGLDLYDVELGGSARARTLRVLVDREGGVDLDAIAAATEALAPILDGDAEVARVLPGSYLLEVSSPGVERPLRTPAHSSTARMAPPAMIPVPVEAGCMYTFVAPWRPCDG